MSRVGLVLVSHSAKLADGLAEVAAQMAPDVAVLAAGGDSEGGLGTDFDRVSDALARADGGAGVILLYDLGSAKMVADLAVEMLGDPGRAYVVDAPFVEGAVAAAVAAQGGADLDAVLGAAASADAVVDDVDDEPGQQVDLLLTNDVGLHARPASRLARALAPFDAAVTVRFGDKQADARSVFALLALGTTGGDRVTVSASGQDAAAALAAVSDLAARRFGDHG